VAGKVWASSRAVLTMAWPWPGARRSSSVSIAPVVATSGQMVPAVGVADADHGEFDCGQALFLGVQGGDVGDQIDQRPVAVIGGQQVIDGGGQRVEDPRPTPLHTIDFEHVSMVGGGYDNKPKPTNLWIASRPSGSRPGTESAHGLGCAGNRVVRGRCCAGRSRQDGGGRGRRRGGSVGRPGCQTTRR
jgi:hypothetical protein